MSLPHPVLTQLLDAQDNFDALAKLLDLLYDPGDLKPTAAAITVGSEPTGWLLCDGRTVSRATYGTLFTALGGGSSPWGPGDGSTTFNLPDFRGRGPIGAGTGSGLTARALAAQVGEEAHTLSVPEMPSHNHGGSTGGDSGYPNTNVYSSGGATNFVGITWGGNLIGGDSRKYQDFAHEHSIGSQGGGGAHNNMQPSVAVNFLIKT